MANSDKSALINQEVAGERPSFLGRIEGEGTVRIFAPAKINLYLKILDRRPDGYHDLDSEVAMLDFGDELTIKKSASGRASVKCIGTYADEMPPQNYNLAYKAVELFKSRYFAADNFEIIIKKEIPSKSGLGGGSSDCAAVLRALYLLYGIPPLKRIKYKDIATLLSSDAPLFMTKGHKRIAKTGEVVKQIGFGRRFYVVLVMPDFRCDTKELYNRWDNISRKKSDSFKKILTTGGVANKNNRHRQEAFGLNAGRVVNDFLDVVAAFEPSIDNFIDVFSRIGAQAVSMTGSGSCLFALFNGREEAEMACETIKAEKAPSFCIVTTLIHF